MNFFARCSICLFLPTCFQAHAEVTTDGSLGQRLTLSGPNFQISNALGQRQGNNLFHSFERFNLNSGESATFSGPNTIQHVISRVSGGELSSINGLLRVTMPQANFWLINPAGIAFGPDAQLDVPAAFHAAAASTLTFDDGIELDASTATFSTFSAAPPTAFGFLETGSVPITTEGSRLQVNNGHTLTLTAGSLQIAQSELQADAGNIHLFAVSDILLDDSQLIVRTPNAADSGAITLDAENTHLDNGTGIYANVGGTGRGAAVNIQASGDLRLSGDNGGEQNFNDDETFIVSHITTAAINETRDGGDSGSIHIRARNAFFEDGARLNTNTRGGGNGGDIVLDVEDSVILSGESMAENAPSPAEFFLETSGSGQGGNLRISANRIELRDGATFNGAVHGRGDAGDFIIRAGEFFGISGQNNRRGGKVKAQVMEQSTGRGGDIDIQTVDMVLDDGASLLVSSFGAGNAGDIKVQASGTITLQGVNGQGRATEIATNSAAEDDLSIPRTGTSGDIVIDTGKLILHDGANISSSAFAEGFAIPAGDAGNINIQVAGDAEFSGVNPHGPNANGFGSGVYARALGFAPMPGRAGRISVAANTLSLLAGGVITSDAIGVAAGGDIDIQANTTHLSGTSFDAPLRDALAVQREWRGILGLVGLLPLEVSNSRVTTSTSIGPGDAGAINLQSTSLTLEQQAIIASKAEAAGGGQINIQVENISTLQSGASVSAEVSDGSGNGGNIDMLSGFLVMETATITTRAVGGNGGQINIRSDGLFSFPGSLIDASSSFGLDGIIEINAPDAEVDEHLVVLPTNFLTAGELATEACDVNELDTRSQYLVTSRTGPRRSPGDWME